MEQIGVELLSRSGNCAVVRLPERRFPGLLIRGDSLSILLDQIREVAAHLDAGNVDEARSEVRSLVDDVGAMIAGYVDTLDMAGIPLPFARPSS